MFQFSDVSVVLLMDLFLFSLMSSQTVETIVVAAVVVVVVVVVVVEHV